MARRWNIAQAKASFSELVREAAESPQEIENRGRGVAVVLGIDEYRLLTEQSARTSDEARVRNFLRLSEELRRQGGAELELPPRATRPSPFTTQPKRKRVRTAPHR